MTGAPEHPREAKRIHALRELQILDTETSESWQRIVELASIICQTPIALVSLIDEERQWFKARIGLDATETPREQAFCGYAILQEGIFTVDDPTNDARFSDNPLVTGDPQIRFYAGVPIKSHDDLPLGTVCVIDRRPRRLDEHQEQALQHLGKQAETLLRIRRLTLRLQASLDIDGTAKDILNAVAHEIMNPLTPAMLQVASLRRDADPDLQQRLDRIERSLLRIRDVIRTSAADLAGET